MLFGRPSREGPCALCRAVRLFRFAQRLRRCRSALDDTLCRRRRKFGRKRILAIAVIINRIFVVYVYTLILGIVCLQGDVILRHIEGRGTFGGSNAGHGPDGEIIACLDRAFLDGNRVAVPIARFRIRRAGELCAGLIKICNRKGEVLNLARGNRLLLILLAALGLGVDQLGFAVGEQHFVVGKLRLVILYLERQLVLRRVQFAVGNIPFQRTVALQRHFLICREAVGHNFKVLTHRVNDRRIIGRVLCNLVGNAVKYIAEFSAVLLQLEFLVVAGQRLCHLVNVGFSLREAITAALILGNTETDAVDSSSVLLCPISLRNRAYAVILYVIILLNVFIIFAVVVVVVISTCGISTTGAYSIRMVNL